VESGSRGYNVRREVDDIKWRVEVYEIRWRVGVDDKRWRGK
jgi:hypothetical protein